MSQGAVAHRGAPLTKEQQALVVGAVHLIKSAVAWYREKGWVILTKDGDLDAIGIAALAEAASSYDPSQGVAFSTYATYRIRGAILDAARAEARRRRLFLPAGADVAAANYLAEQPDLPEAGWGEVDHRWRQRSESFSGGLAAAIVASMAADVLNAQDDGEEAFARRQAYTRVIDAIQSARAELVDREREVLDLHYGQEVGLQTVAERLKVAYATVKRIHASMLENLAKKLRKVGIKSLADAGLYG